MANRTTFKHVRTGEVFKRVQDGEVYVCIPSYHLSHGDYVNARNLRTGKVVWIFQYESVITDLNEPHSH